MNQHEGKSRTTSECDILVLRVSSGNYTSRVET